MVREGECVGGGTRKEGRRKEERGERVGKEQSVGWCLDKGRKRRREQERLDKCRRNGKDGIMIMQVKLSLNEGDYQYFCFILFYLICGPV